MGAFNNALKYLEEKQFQKAEGVLKELLKNNPEDVNILYNLGACFQSIIFNYKD